MIIVYSRAFQGKFHCTIGDRSSPQWMSPPKRGEALRGAQALPKMNDTFRCTLSTPFKVKHMLLVESNIYTTSKARIRRRRLSIFGHVRRLPEATPAHSALRLAVDARAGGKPDIRTEWKRQRGQPCRTWVQQIEDDTGSTPTTPGGSHMTASLGGRYDPWPVKSSTD